MEDKKDELRDIESEVNNLEVEEVEVEEVEEPVLEEVESEIPEEGETTSEASSDEKEDELQMFKRCKDDNKKLNNELEALKDRLLRITAEYENYRKRTAKEKDGIYTDACYDVLKEVIPVVDNLERALIAGGTVEDLKKGLEMTMKGCQTSLEKLGVEEIDASSDFDPNLHQAVMHIEDENVGANQVVEVFMKGYKKGDKVIRHSVVKVAN